MLDELLPYYERELSHLRFLGQEFAAQYPKIASRLLIEGDNCEDPHTERLIEAFSFLSARVHKKLDDEFPEIVESFLEVLYPHYLRPTPSMSIAELSLGKHEKVTEAYRVARHTEMHANAVEGVVCKFRTCYPVALWPIAVQQASFSEMERSAFNGHSADLVAHLRIRLGATGDALFGQMEMDCLRFFLDGEATLMLQLYELLFNNLAKVTLSFQDQGRTREVALAADALKPVGYARDEGLVDYSERSFLGYRLLHEYFTFPDKFMFFDLSGFARILQGKAVEQVELNFYFSDYDLSDRLTRLTQNIGRNNFKLNCTPIINLFRQQAEPIKLTHTRHEYPVTPDTRLHNAAEVVSIDRVRRVRKLGGVDQVDTCQPFFEPRGEQDPRSSFWTARRRSQGDATAMSIRVVDRNLELIDASNDTLSIGLTCSNRDVPLMLPFGGERGDFNIPANSVIKDIRCLRKPTATVRVPLGKGLIWRLIAHLSLNHLSLVSQGREVLLELLSLYNYRNVSAIRKQINGIKAIDSEPVVARIGHPRPNFVRGVGITLTLDESQFTGSGVFLFGTVLDHFFGQYCSMNSFTQLTLRTQQREKRVAQWPARTGDQPLV
ncbi:type VI secretion system baseplate subunit TssF [Pseudomonas sp. CM25]|uniref:type VI secretion system baseplate subunit TssF n=1 Tax=unclassified Pseudomonas TaxID=196821 RepID=UPI001551693F|nr:MULTISPECIES: type VI secretion system baseplate subunit TssF [unclassified Pseudomonas]NQD55113.1 type VI secretion system baseplate subunit TssF [Pseudomonas sp. CM25]NQD76053.1 type VI secretion system baseplate subunit TssF [Pseudomonas sp. CM27]HEN8800320.1 type VI secretion system baseplate subunit TssF [Pseudomonas putida]